MLCITSLPVEGNVNFCRFRFKRFCFGLDAAADAAAADAAAAAPTSSTSSSGLGKRINEMF